MPITPERHPAFDRARAASTRPTRNRATSQRRPEPGKKRSEARLARAGRQPRSRSRRPRGAGLALGRAPRLGAQGPPRAALGSAKQDASRTRYLRIMRRLLGLRGPARPSAPRPVRLLPSAAGPAPRPARAFSQAVRAQLQQLGRGAPVSSSAAPPAGSPSFSAPKQLKSFTENLEVTYRIARAKGERFTSSEKAVLGSLLLSYWVLPPAAVLWGCLIFNEGLQSHRSFASLQSKA